MPIGNVFHAGDGNLHPLILFDERNKEMLERVHQVAYEILKICVDAGGTISGEHGIGTEKLKEMSFVFSESDIEFMRSIKKAFDPRDMWNPGKVIPPVHEHDEKGASAEGKMTFCPLPPLYGRVGHLAESQESLPLRNQGVTEGLNSVRVILLPSAGNHLTCMIFPVIIPD